MKTVLVTGASSGFGSAVALGFAREGHVVYAAGRNVQRLRGVCAEAEEEGAMLALVQLDITDATSRVAVVGHIEAVHGGVDVLVNNAGVLHVGPFERTPDSVLRHVLETNLFGALALTQAVLPGMRERGFGRVVNVTAIGAVLSTPFLAAYCASKHALDAAAAAIDVEVRPFGVRVASVLPGRFRTALLDRSTAAVDDGPYTAADEYRRGLRTRLDEGGSDFSRVVAAVLTAASACDPPVRQVVANDAIESLLAPAITELDALHGLHAVPHAESVHTPTSHEDDR